MSRPSGRYNAAVPPIAAVDFATASAGQPWLVVDAAEWFLDPAWRGHVTARHWRRLPSRASLAIAAVAAELARAGRRATWLVAGELATRAPALLRELAAAGHELALGVVSPVAYAEVPAAQQLSLLQQWRQQRCALEVAAGAPVLGFGALPPVGQELLACRAGLAGIGFGYELDLGRGTAVPTVGPAPDPDRPASPRQVAAVPIQCFQAWRLDAAAPELHGLPRRLRRAHAALVATGREALAQWLAAAAAPAPTVAAAFGGVQALAAAIAPAVAACTATLASQVSVAAPVALASRGHTAPPAPRLGIVVPLKDEAAGLEALFVELAAVAHQLADVATCEFVFVDDGSTDRTWPLLQQLSQGRPDCRLVQHAQNRGVAAAIRTGLLATDAPLVASIDGDLSYDPLELRAMLAAQAATAADVVTASPYHVRGGVRNVPGWRLGLSRSLSAVYRLLLRQPIHTWTACFRVYRRAAVVALPQQHPGFLGTAELLVRVLRRGGRVVEHPCVLEARLFGVSKMKVLRTIRQHLGLLWQVACRRIR